MAEEVVRLCEEPNEFTQSYELDLSIEEKLDAIVKKNYHGDGVALTPTAKKQAAQLTELGFDKCPICVAKTQYSFSDNADNKYKSPCPLRQGRLAFFGKIYYNEINHS